MRVAGGKLQLGVVVEHEPNRITVVVRCGSHLAPNTIVPVKKCRCAAWWRAAGVCHDDHILVHAKEAWCMQT